MALWDGVDELNWTRKASYGATPTTPSDVAQLPSAVSPHCRVWFHCELSLVCSRLSFECGKYCCRALGRAGLRGAPPAYMAKKGEEGSDDVDERTSIYLNLTS